MKRYLFLLITALFALSVSGQKQEVIASAGGYNTASGISISWTLGETIIPQFKAPDNSIILTHGFQQQLIITTVDETLEALVKVTVFPNPASEIINIEFEEPVDGEINLFLLNSLGKLVKTDVIESTSVNKQINLQDLPGGIYYLKLVKGKLSNVYKVVKL
jgi:hypothetical protein